MLRREEASDVQVHGLLSVWCPHNTLKKIGDLEYIYLRLHEIHGWLWASLSLGKSLDNSTLDFVGVIEVNLHQRLDQLPKVAL